MQSVTSKGRQQDVPSLSNDEREKVETKIRALFQELGKQPGGSNHLFVFYH